MQCSPLPAQHIVEVRVDLVHPLKPQVADPYQEGNQDAEGQRYYRVCGNPFLRHVVFLDLDDATGRLLATRPP